MVEYCRDGSVNPTSSNENYKLKYLCSFNDICVIIVDTRLLVVMRRIIVCVFMYCYLIVKPN